MFCLLSTWKLLGLGQVEFPRVLCTLTLALESSHLLAGAPVMPKAHGSAKKRYLALDSGASKR